MHGVSLTATVSYHSEGSDDLVPWKYVVTRDDNGERVASGWSETAEIAEARARDDARTWRSMFDPEPRSFPV